MEGKARLLGRNVVLWLGFLVLAFANGALREVLLVPVLGEPTAHHLSALTAVALFTIYGVAVWPRMHLASWRDAALVGGTWLVLTVLFETFVLNRWMSGLSWDAVLATYDVASGELWPLVLGWLALLPAVLMALRGPVRGSRRPDEPARGSRERPAR